MLDFSTYLILAEVAMDVFLYIRAFPNLDYPYPVVVPQGGAVVPRQRFYRPLLHRIRAVLYTASWAIVLYCPTVVPRALAVVPRLRCGSTMRRRLS